MPMKLKEITAIIEEEAPLMLQESYDNAGLLLGSGDKDIRKALICLDVTEPVIDEAIDKDCNLIISHHPLIFKAFKTLNVDEPVERILVRAIKHDIAIYAAHTNLDNVIGGVSGFVARKLELTDVQILSPQKGTLRKLVTFCPVDKAEDVRNAIFHAGAGHIGNYDYCSFNLEGSGSFRPGENSNPYIGEEGSLHFEQEIRIETIYPVYRETAIINAMIEAHPYEEVAYDLYSLNNLINMVGSGVIGSLREGIKENDFLEKIKDVFNIPCIRHSALTGRKIKKVALCGGSGSFLINVAKKAGADAFLTGDINYHSFFEADGRVLLADIGHFESEIFTKELLHDILFKKIPTFAVLISEQQTNAVHYF